MIDIRFNQAFDTVLGQNDDLPTVEGANFWEQRLAHMVTDYYYEAISEAIPPQNIKALVRLYTQRAARDMEGLDEIESFEARFDDRRPDLLYVTVHYSIEEVEDYEFLVNTQSISI